MYYNVFTVGELPLASLRLFRLRAPFHGCSSGPAQNVLLLGGRKAHELHWPAQIDPPHPPMLEHQGSLWPRAQSILQRPIPAPWSAREAAPRNGGPIFLGLFFLGPFCFFFGSIFLVFPKKTTIPSIFLKDLMHFRGFSYEKQ